MHFASLFSFLVNVLLTWISNLKHGYHHSICNIAHICQLKQAGICSMYVNIKSPPLPGIESHISNACRFHQSHYIQSLLKIHPFALLTVSNTSRFGFRPTDPSHHFPITAHIYSIKHIGISQWHDRSDRSISLLLAPSWSLYISQSLKNCVLERHLFV